MDRIKRIMELEKMANAIITKSNTMQDEGFTVPNGELTLTMCEGSLDKVTIREHIEDGISLFITVYKNQTEQ